MEYTGASIQTTSDLQALEEKHDLEVVQVRGEIAQAVDDASADRTLIRSSLTTEVNRATARENQLQADLTQEVQDRETAIHDEQQARSDADDALNVRLTAMEEWKTANTDELANYVNGEVDKAINSKVDESFFQQVQQQLTDADSALSQRISNHIVDRENTDEDHKAKLKVSSDNDLVVKDVLEQMRAYLDVFSQTYTIKDQNDNVVSPPDWSVMSASIASIASHEANATATTQ